MKKWLFITLAFLLTGSYSLMAQFDAQVTHHWAVPNYYNPGYVGSSNKLNITALGRLQWVGIEDAPKTVLVLAEMPWQFAGRKHGVGVSMYNDQIGLFSANVLSGQYAYRTKLWGGDLGVGIQLGYISETFKGDSIYVPGVDKDGTGIGSGSGSTSSVYPVGTLSDKTIDVGLGAFYSTPKMYVGLSVAHLVAPKLELNERTIMEIPRSYYFTAGYNIHLNNPLLELQPSILLKTVEPSSFEIENDSIYVDNKKESILKAMWTQTQIDLSLRMVYNKMLWVGVSWRGATWERRDAVMAMLGGRFKGFEIGYSFDYPLNALRYDSKGSHELFLRYSIDMSKKKKTTNKHKSVRIL